MCCIDLEEQAAGAGVGLAASGLLAIVRKLRNSAQASPSAEPAGSSTPSGDEATLTTVESTS